VVLGPKSPLFAAISPPFKAPKQILPKKVGRNAMKIGRNASHGPPLSPTSFVLSPMSTWLEQKPIKIAGGHFRTKSLKTKSLSWGTVYVFVESLNGPQCPVFRARIYDLVGINASEHFAKSPLKPAQPSWRERALGRTWPLKRVAPPNGN
jgi:hypothetical protein